MGKPMMIQEGDDKRIEKLKHKLGVKSKIDVVREALSLLEEKAERIEKIKRWEKAVKLAAKQSQKVFLDFNTSSHPFKKND